MQNPALKKKYANAWSLIENAEKHFVKIRENINLLENGYAFNSQLFRIARTIVRLKKEDAKPNAKRLKEFRDSNKDSLLQQLFSPAPIYKNLEEHMLADSLALLLETWGNDHPLVKKILAGKSPQDRAHELVAESLLDNPEERKRLAASNAKTVFSSMDRMIRLALLVDKEARTARKDFEENVEEIRQQGYAKIAEAQFALRGENVYPDATFTLRFAFGHALGYEEHGKNLPSFTTIGGTFTHADTHEHKWPWELPRSWNEKKDALIQSDAAFNFVTTHDTHGGNSGSPVIDADLNIVGLLFDGNIHKPANHFRYTDDRARSISVHTAGILEALKTVYKTKRLIQELTT